MAGATPFRPEINHDQMLVRGFYDIAFKVVQVGIENALILAEVFMFVIMMLQRHWVSIPCKNGINRASGSCL
jgi:hypothetical protein